MLDSLTLKDAFFGVVAIISGIAVIKQFISPFFSIKSNYSKELESFKEEIKQDLTEIKMHREESRDLNLLILEGVTASLYAHRDRGANGPVTHAIESIEAYKLKKAVQ